MAARRRPDAEMGLPAHVSAAELLYLIGCLVLVVAGLLRTLPGRWPRDRSDDDSTRDDR